MLRSSDKDIKTLMRNMFKDIKLNIVMMKTNEKSQNK